MLLGSTDLTLAQSIIRTNTHTHTQSHVSQRGAFYLLRYKARQPRELNHFVKTDSARAAAAQFDFKTTKPLAELGIWQLADGEPMCQLPTLMYRDAR